MPGRLLSVAWPCLVFICLLRHWDASQADVLAIPPLPDSNAPIFLATG